MIHENALPPFFICQTSEKGRLPFNQLSIKMFSLGDLIDGGYQVLN